MKLSERSINFQFAITVGGLLLLLLNVNSMMGKSGGLDNDQVREKTQTVFNSVGDGLDKAQTLTEDGGSQVFSDKVSDSILSGSFLKASRKEAPVQVQATDTLAENDGNIGEVVSTTGSSVLNLFLPSEKAVFGKNIMEVQAQTRHAVSEAFEEPNQQFKNLVSPSMSVLMTSEEQVDAISSHYQVAEISTDKQGHLITGNVQ